MAVIGPNGAGKTTLMLHLNGLLGAAAGGIGAAVAAALGSVGLSGLAQRRTTELSIGEKRRVALAGVLAMEPDVLVLDEPSANLDPAARADLARIVAGLPQTVVMVTHDLPYAGQLCSRTVLLDAGRIIADAPTVEPGR